MYNKFMIFDEDFQDRFILLKQKNNPTEVFKFLKEYVTSIENGGINSKRFVINVNPLRIDKQTQKFIREFNAYFLEFLVKMASVLTNRKLSSEAHVYLGLTYELGLFGISINQKNAFNYYIVAAKQNNRFGTYRLAQAYEKVMGDKEGYTKALYFYRCAAKLGCIYGMHTYGSILLRGELDSKKDFDTGMFYLKLASQKASEIYPFPFYDLGQVYESHNSCNEIEADDDYAFRMYERGARLGCPNSQYKVGKCYETGSLFRYPNMKLALEYYKKAADNGHMDAQYILSKFLFTGVEGLVSRNYNQSFFYALQSAIRGHPEGAYLVAEFAEWGYGVKKSRVLSLWWYTIASKLGNKQADLKKKELRIQINLDNKGPSYKGRRWCFFC
ncbi:hypothetical protein P3W45_001616 [Vairimorpha bombi]